MEIKDTELRNIMDYMISLGNGLKDDDYEFLSEIWNRLENIEIMIRDLKYAMNDIRCEAEGYNEGKTSKNIDHEDPPLF